MFTRQGLILTLVNMVWNSSAKLNLNGEGNKEHAYDYFSTINLANWLQAVEPKPCSVISLQAEIGLSSFISCFADISSAAERGYSARRLNHEW
jgi:hypothetical protein